MLCRITSGIDRAAQPFAGILDQRLQPVQVQRPAHAGLHHVHHVRLRLGLGRRLLLGAQPGALLAVEHVGARDIVLARAHQGELHLVLDVLDVQRAAAGLAPHQRGDHLLGEPGHLLAHARRGRALAAVHGQKRLGHRHRDLARLEADHRAVAANDLVLGERRLARRALVVLPRAVPADSARDSVLTSCIKFSPRASCRSAPT